jgi:type IV pilus assembly protein PilE
VVVVGAISGMTGRPPRDGGFTLIELVVTVAIVAILSTLAVRSYRSYVIRSNRADAEQLLLQAAQTMERNYTQFDSYKTAFNPPPATGTITLSKPAQIGFSQSPLSPGKAVYTFQFPSPPTTTYFVVTAVPVATGINKDDGKLEIDSSGRKGWDKNNDGTIDPTTEDTWSQ